MKNLLVLVFILFSTIILADKVSFKLFSEEILLDVNQQKLPYFPSKTNETEARLFYKRMESNSEIRLLTSQFNEYRKKLKLNDWLYYCLLKNASTALYKGKETIALFCWYFLNEDGFKTAINYNSSMSFSLYVGCQEELYSVFKSDRENDNAYYYDFESGSVKNDKSSPLYEMVYKFKNHGKVFSFHFNYLPQLSHAVVIEKTISFRNKSKEILLTIKVNQTLSEIYKSLPQNEILSYLELPISEELQGSLVKELKNIFREWDEYDKTRFLLSMVRMSTKYKDDKEIYNENITFASESYFLSEFTDCEDRTVVFSQFFRLLVKKPIIILDYPNHITLAVNLKKGYGIPIKFKGKKYYFCEPTNTNNNLLIGDFGNYKNKAYEIRKAYKR